MESEPTATTERTKDSIDTHVRCKCSKCGHEGDVWIDPVPLFVARINDMVIAGLETASEHIDVARAALKRALDFEGANDRTLAIKSEVRAALDVIGWNEASVIGWNASKSPRPTSPPVPPQGEKP